MRKDVLSWLFAGFLILIIIITNPFTSPTGNVTVDIMSDYNKLNSSININQLSASEKKDYAEEYVYMARQFVKHDKFDRAIEAINTAIELNPYYENIYNDLGSVYLSKISYFSGNNVEKIKNSKELQLAKELFQKNINDYPDSPTSFDGLINLYITVGKYDQAIETATIGCFAKPAFKNRCKKVADLHLLKGDRDKAIDFYRNLTTIINNSDISWVYRRIGYIYHAEGSCKEAKKYFKQAYKVHPTKENLEAVVLTCYDNSLYEQNYR